MQFRLPYFDKIFSRLECSDPQFEAAFLRHMHCGSWEDPDNAYDDVADSITAPERLCQQLINLAEIGHGQDILDVGCGFGGTLASIDEQFSQMRLTGLNIDPRQIETARKLTPRDGNSLAFVHGDACEMDFAENSFDRILAIECIFHFASRQKFFEHVGRMLRPGGNLTMTDFLQPNGRPQLNIADPSFWGPYSAIDLPTYEELAAEVGLVVTHCQDISRNVRPSYHYFGQTLGQHFPEAIEACRNSLLMMDLGCLKYCTLRFGHRQDP